MIARAPSTVLVDFKAKIVLASKAIENLDNGSAQGTFTVNTPCLVQSVRGIAA
jgi:hypothetical protein